MEGPELALIQTERLGFLALAGDAKVQLTPSWSSPPVPTASLLAIASRRAIVAAAGPDFIYVSSTKSVRAAFENPKNGDSEVRPCEVETKIPMSVRLSHIAFTPDEKYLIMSAQEGGGMAVYQTQTLLQGSARPDFEISTSMETIKTLTPNPMPELADFCAVVTTNGNLLMADFKEKNLSRGSNGPVLRAGVTSVGWSTKGKQLVAGLADGNIVQMTPDGTEKGVIPKPSSLSNFSVSSVSWLENHVFLVIYNNPADIQESHYFVITRSQPAKQTPSFEYRRLSEDPVMPFGNILPPHHTILRLRDHPPAIQELLIVSSSVSDNLGLLTKAKTSLANQDFPPELVTNVFTTTEFSDDSRRAQLPTGEHFLGTTPIGVALDLSSDDKVYRPVADDEEIDFSPGPLPGAWTLSNEGVLSAWWVVYYDAIRANEIYPGLAALQSETVSQSSAPAPALSGSAASEKPLLAPTNPFTAPAAVTSGAFSAPAFGSASALGTKPAPPAFGQHGGLGTKISPWATGATGAASAFGSHGFASPAAPAAAASGKLFGASAAPTISAAGSGLAGLAGQSGFAGLGSKKGGDSVFSKTTSSNPFGSAATGGPSAFGGGGKLTAFGNTSAAGPFGPQQTPASSTGLFPTPGATPKPVIGGSPFVLGTTFKADPISANDNEKPSGKGSFNLGAFGLSLETAEPMESKDENMDTEAPIEQEKTTSIFDRPQSSTTPISTPAPSNIFSTAAKPADAPASTSSVFGSTRPPPKINPFARTVAKPNASPSPFGSLFGGSDSSKPSAAYVATEPPLPPDATSKTAYPFGESSSSSIASAKTIEDPKNPSDSVDEEPLPPDFVAPKRSNKLEMAPPPLPKEASSSVSLEDAPLPPDFTKPKVESKPSLFDKPVAPLIPESSNDEVSEDFDSDDDGEGENEDDNIEEGEAEDEQAGESEGSGIDVAKDLSPGSVGTGHTPGQTPQSSFGGIGGSAFSLVSRPDVAQPPRSSIFGATVPVLTKPAPTSPRSPSPVRTAWPSRMLQGEGSRSVSAPSGVIRPQTAMYSKSVSSRVQPKDDPNLTLQREAQKKQAEQDEQSLEDDEYEHVQANLARPLEPTLDVDNFNAYVSVTADAHASTVAAQVEALYRDMNGMMLALGLNARALSAFIQGHEQRASNSTKSQVDLDRADEWVLCEAEDLERVLDDEVAPELEDARVQDVRDTWDTCQDLLRELPKLRAKKTELKRIIESVLDPDQAEAARQTQLTPEQAAQRQTLRQAYASVTKLMAQAENALTMLKTRLATLSTSASAQPTVEAIIRTINRMTSAAEKRSGDVDIIESQMRKLRVTGSVAPSASREGTPEAFRTPTPNKRSSLSRTLHGGSTFSPSPVRSLNGSASRSGPSPRKKISGFTAEDKYLIRQKMAKRQVVLDRLRNKLVENGAKVSRMGDTR